MQLIDSTYFVNELDLPTSQSDSDALPMFIEEYQKELLVGLLGYELYKLFETAMASNAPAARFAALRDGAMFEYGTIQYFWKGFREIITVPKDAVVADPDAVPPVLAQDAIPGTYRSIIANYVYYKYQRNRATQTTQIGETATKAENSVIVSSHRKQTNAMRKLEKEVNVFFNFMYVNVNDYPEYNRQESVRFYKQHIYGVGII